MGPQLLCPRPSSVKRRSRWGLSRDRPSLGRGPSWRRPCDPWSVKKGRKQAGRFPFPVTGTSSCSVQYLPVLLKPGTHQTSAGPRGLSVQHSVAMRAALCCPPALPRAGRSPLLPSPQPRGAKRPPGSQGRVDPRMARESHSIPEQAPSPPPPNPRPASLQPTACCGHCLLAPWQTTPQEGQDGYQCGRPILPRVQKPQGRVPHPGLPPSPRSPTSPPRGLQHLTQPHHLCLPAAPPPRPLARAGTPRCTLSTAQTPVPKASPTPPSTQHSPPAQSDSLMFEFV